MIPCCEHCLGCADRGDLGPLITLDVIMTVYSAIPEEHASAVCVMGMTVDVVSGVVDDLVFEDVMITPTEGCAVMQLLKCGIAFNDLSMQRSIDQVCDMILAEAWSNDRVAEEIAAQNDNAEEALCEDEDSVGVGVGGWFGVNAG